MRLSSRKKREKGYSQSLFNQRKGQVTIFIIVAIILIVGILVYFLARGSFQSEGIPENFQPAYTNFLTCLEDEASTGISVLQSQGGYIYLPDFEEGSSHMPFSSRLNFAGTSIPYWYYVSGNNIQREQVPTKEQMENQLEVFINEKITGCSFESYHNDGFEVEWSEPVSQVSIGSNAVDVTLDMNLNFNRDEESVLIRNHEVRVDSNLGSLYDSAVQVYDESQESLFLENYAVDTLRLYAPVDGVEVSCSPKIWSAEEIFDDLQEAIESNTVALSSQASVDEYFLVDLPVREEVRFINSKNWPHSFEVTPSEGNLLMANPIGNQQGLGALGFCYIPYHFVYSAKYPVLVQVYSGEEIFQFPLAVVVENNNPRESLEVEANLPVESELCQYRNTEISVNVRDKQGNPILADISYECSGDRCNIGRSSGAGTLSENFPQCANGFVTARAEGFKDASYLFSTIDSGSLTIIMDKIHTNQVQLKVDGINYNGDAIIHFRSEDLSRTVVYPDQKEVSLAEGQYEVQVQIYEDSSITFPETVTEQCVETPRPGFLGFFGAREETCFDIEVPEEVVSQALVGGGNQDHFILESDLVSSNTIEINVEGFSTPESGDDLQVNHLLYETSGLEINFI